MNRSRAGARLLILKTFCIALTLIFGTILFSAGSLAGQGCGSKCCCQSNPNSMSHDAGKQIRVSAGCSGTPVIPCDLESTQELDLPEFTLCATGFNFPRPGGSAVILDQPRSDGRNFSGIVISQPVGQKINSPPIYLQKLSFLI